MEASRRLTPQEVRRKISDEMLTFDYTESGKLKLKNIKLYLNHLKKIRPQQFYQALF